MKNTRNYEIDWNPDAMLEDDFDDLRDFRVFDPIEEEAEVRSFIKRGLVMTEEED